MRPTGSGGVVLESRAEIALALNTVTAGTPDFGLEVATPQDHDQIASLEPKLLGANRAGLDELELDGAETATLRNACTVGTANHHHALGYVSCIQIMSGVSAKTATEGLITAGNTDLNIAGIVARAGAAASTLSVLLDLCSGQPPT